MMSASSCAISSTSSGSASAATSRSSGRTSRTPSRRFGPGLRRSSSLPGVISAHAGALERHGVLSRAGARSLYDPGVLRALLVVTCLFGCKKKEREMATELPPTPSTGHSITHFKDASEAVAEGSGTASAGSGSAAVPVDAEPVKGMPAYRDPDGRVHGPGGPVNMGKGANCDAEHDHCMRDGV